MLIHQFGQLLDEITIKYLKSLIGVRSHHMCMRTKILERDFLPQKRAVHISFHTKFAISAFDLAMVPSHLMSNTPNFQVSDKNISTQ